MVHLPWRMILGLASRNILRNRIRTFFMTLTIAFGVGVIVWMQCLLEGRNRHIIDSITSTYTGHLQIYKSEYLKDKQIQLSYKHGIRELLPLKTPGLGFAQRVHLPALISSGEQSAPVLLDGIEPEHEAGITRIKNYLSEGSYLEGDPDANCPSRQIYIGKALAQTLNVTVGSKVVILAQAADGTLGNELLRIKGLFSNGGGSFDKQFVFAPLSCVQKIGAISGVHETVLRLPAHYSEADETALQGRIRASLPEGLIVTNWREALPPMASLVRFNNALLLMISTILFIVVTLGIVNALLMSIFERTREFGVMVALGTSPGQLRAIILAESLLIGALGAAAGSALGLLLVAYHGKYGFDLHPFLGDSKEFYQFQLDFLIFPVFTLIPFLKSIAAALAFILLAGIYPAYRASTLRPIEAMR